MRPCYSPEPIESYFLEGKFICPVEAVSNLDLADEVWNLFWMSLPELDVIPNLGKDWHSKYKSNQPMQQAIITDVYEDEVLFRKLGMMPEAFLRWFRDEDHSLYDSFEIGGQVWVDTVIKRAEEAAVRMYSTKASNVIKVKFGRAA